MLRILKKYLANILDNSADDEFYQPPRPLRQSSLFVGTPEAICKQYVSMQPTSQNLFDLAYATKSRKDFVEAAMRLAATSTAAIFGNVFFFARDLCDVQWIKPENVNRLLYSDLLVDVCDFAFIMLQYCIVKSDFAKENLSDEDVRAILESNSITDLYFPLVFAFLTTVDNAEFSFHTFKNCLKEKEKMGEDLGKFPSAHSKKSFDEMIEARLIGDPNTLQAFNVDFLVNSFFNPIAVWKFGELMRKSALCSVMVPRVRKAWA